MKCKRFIAFYENFLIRWGDIVRWKNLILYLLCAVLVVGTVLFALKATSITVDGIRDEERVWGEQLENDVSGRVRQYEDVVEKQREEQRRREEEKRKEQERLEQEQREREEVEKNNQDKKNESSALDSLNVSVLDENGQYVIQYGDTLSPVDYIADVNGITNVNLINTGHKLSFPQKPSDHSTYMIQDEDTLTEIAVSQGQDMNVISKDNHLRNDNLIYGGTPLWIPEKTAND